MDEGSRSFHLVEERPEQPPEGRLIEQALERITPRMTQKKAAAAAGMSDARWRQLVTGYVSVGNGYFAPQTARPDTLARMAKAVGVTPAQLAEVGRDDAAQELIKLGGETAERPTENFPVGTGVDPVDLTRISAEEYAVATAAILAMRKARGERSE